MAHWRRRRVPMAVEATIAAPRPRLGSALAQPTAHHGQVGARAIGHRQFDFWVGHWDVFVRSGKKAGETRGERIAEGRAARAADRQRRRGWQEPQQLRRERSLLAHHLGGQRRHLLILTGGFVDRTC
jgi:hypothetical protein